jgi:hypothetical protein
MKVTPPVAPYTCMKVKLHLHEATFVCSIPVLDLTFLKLGPYINLAPNNTEDYSRSDTDDHSITDYSVWEFRMELQLLFSLFCKLSGKYDFDPPRFNLFERFLSQPCSLGADFGARSLCVMSCACWKLELERSNCLGGCYAVQSPEYCSSLSGL